MICGSIIILPNFPILYYYDFPILCHKVFLSEIISVGTNNWRRRDELANPCSDGAIYTPFMLIYTFGTYCVVFIVMLRTKVLRRTLFGRLFPTKTPRLFTFLIHNTPLVVTTGQESWQRCTTVKKTTRLLVLFQWDKYMYVARLLPSDKNLVRLAVR